MGHSQKYAENLAASSVAEVQMSLRSGRRLHASEYQPASIPGLTLHQTEKNVRRHCPFVSLVQHDNGIFSAIWIDQ